MEAVSLGLFVLGLLLLPLLAVLLMALCVRCRELPGEWVLVGCPDAQTHRQGSSPHAPTPLSLFNSFELLRAPYSITLCPRHPLFLPHGPSLPQAHMTLLPPMGESAPSTLGVSLNTPCRAGPQGTEMGSGASPSCLPKLCLSC